MCPGKHALPAAALLASSCARWFCCRPACAALAWAWTRADTDVPVPWLPLWSCSVAAETDLTYLFG